MTKIVKPTIADITRRLRDVGLKPPESVTLGITNYCNLNCRHCWPGSGPDNPASLVPKDKVARVIEGFSALGAQKFTITGGEPLTHPDWIDLLFFACGMPDVTEVRLQTNAILIDPSHLEVFASLKDKGLIIQTSLEGVTPEVHDRIRGRGTFKQTLQGLQVLIEGGLASHIYIAFTEMGHNYEQLPDLLEMIDSLGIGHLVSGTLVCDGRAKQSFDLTPPTPRQYEKLLTRFQHDSDFRERYNRIGNIAALEWAFAETDVTETCCTLIETPYVTGDGDLYPCTLLQADNYAAARFFEKPFTVAVSEQIESWGRLQQISRSRLEQLKTCKHCTGYAKCRGGCMGRAYAAHRDFFTVEDRCHLRKAVYRTGSVEKKRQGTMSNEKYLEQERLNTELKQAMYSRDYDKARRLIDRGADPNTKNGWGSPFIYWCSENNRIDLIDFAIEKGGDINATNKNGETAMHKVAQLGSVEMIDPLLERGADINHKNIYDTTPLFVAALSNQFEMAKKLLSRGADPAIPNHNGITAAQKAEEKGYDEITALLAAK